MFKPGTKVLFQEPTSDVQLLRSASVVESHEDSFSIQFDGDPIELDEGLELIAYFHADRDFMQQVVRVIALVEDGDKLVVDLEPTGDAASAEQRPIYRASAISADLFAQLGEDRNLSVQDVSSSGFAVVSSIEYRIGATLDVSLRFEGDMFSGTASVQSIRELSPTRIRYGLRAQGGGDLEDGLRQISLAMQRQQLKGQSGAG